MQLATGGFSTAAEWFSEFGVHRDYLGFVWHDMEGFLPGALAEWAKGKASATLAILRSGVIVLTCKLENVAWHAGTNNVPSGGAYGRTPFWRANNANPHTMGVELEGFAGQPYTPSQAQAVRKIALWGEAKYHIPRVHTFNQFVGHHAHGELSTSRHDPGPTFDWNWVTGA